MIKVTVNESVNGGGVYCLQDIKVGEAFNGTVGSTSSVFLRTFSGLVNLKDPATTWSKPDTIIDVDYFVDLDITASRVSARR